MRSEKPFMQWNMAPLVKRPDGRGERFPARLALVDTWARALAAKFGRISDNTAMRADRTIRPTERLKMSPCAFFVIKDRIGEIDGHRVPLSCYLYSDFLAVRQVHNCLRIALDEIDT